MHNWQMLNVTKLHCCIVTFEWMMLSDVVSFYSATYMQAFVFSSVKLSGFFPQKSDWMFGSLIFFL